MDDREYQEEEKAEDQEKNPEESTEPEFPPWPVRTLIIWMFGFLILSGVLGSLLGIAVAVTNIKFNLGLSMEEQVFIARLPAQAVYLGTAFAFIIFRLRKTSFSLSDIWISFRMGSTQVVASLLLGTLLMSLSALTFKLVTGHVAPPPTSPIRLDWRLMLSVELLVDAFMVGVVEEIFFRGLIYEAMRLYYHTTSATLLSALVFAAFHVELILNPLGMLFIFTFGIIAAILFEHTRSLNTCICFHISASTTVNVIYYLMYIIPK